MKDLRVTDISNHVYQVVIAVNTSEIIGHENEEKF